MRVRALLGLAVALCGYPTWAQDATDVLDDAALAGLRGGLLTPSGLDIGFGASVRTFVDGKLVLQTDMVWTPEGVQTDRVLDRTGPDGASGASVGTGDPSAPVRLGPGTQVIHDLAGGRVASVLMNTASDRNIRQDTDITLRLPQLPQIQRQDVANRVAAGLQAAAAPFRQ